MIIVIVKFIIIITCSSPRTPCGDPARPTTNSYFNQPVEFKTRKYHEQFRTALGEAGQGEVESGGAKPSGVPKTKTTVLDAPRRPGRPPTPQRYLLARNNNNDNVNVYGHYYHQ